MPITAPARLPKVQPIVPAILRTPFNDPAWLFEPKYDGFRGVLYLTRRGCTFYSKRGNTMARFSELAEQVRAELPCRDVILDGEIVALDDEGRIGFWDLMRRRGTLAYVAFDVVWLNGRDLQPTSTAATALRVTRRSTPATAVCCGTMMAESASRKCLDGDGRGRATPPPGEPTSICYDF